MISTSVANALPGRLLPSQNMTDFDAFVESYLVSLNTIPFIHPAILVAGVDNLWHRQYTAYSSQHISSVLASVIDVVQLSNTLKFESAISYRLAPNLL